jgi:hypothetical protein
VGQEQFIDEYMRRPILPLKERFWQTQNEIGAEPSTLIEGEMEKLMAMKGK